MSATPDRNRLQAALAEADLRVLLMVMFQISGEERWLQEPYRARRDVKLIADEDAGFTPELQAEIRVAALQMLTDQELSPAHPVPEEALLLRMMSVCLGKKVAPEYAPTMREQMGFASVLESLTPLRVAGQSTPRLNSSRSIDDNVITTNRQFKPHQVLGEDEVFRSPSHEDICGNTVGWQWHQMIVGHHAHVRPRVQFDQRSGRGMVVDHVRHNFRLPGAAAGFEGVSQCSDQWQR